MTHIVHVGGSEDSTLLVMDLGNAALASLQQLQVLTGKWGGGMSAPATSAGIASRSAACRYP